MRRERLSDGPATAAALPRDAEHPGELLARELARRGVSASAAAQQMRVPPTRLSEILRGRRGVSAETALRLGRYFGMPAYFWVGAQTRHELALAERAFGARVAREVEPVPDPEDEA